MSWLTTETKLDFQKLCTQARKEAFTLCSPPIAVSFCRSVWSFSAISHDPPSSAQAGDATSQLLNGPLCAAWGPGKAQLEARGSTFLETRIQGVREKGRRGSHLKMCPQAARVSGDWLLDPTGLAEKSSFWGKRGRASQMPSYCFLKVITIPELPGPSVYHPITWSGESYLPISSPLKCDLLRAASRQLVPLSLLWPQVHMRPCTQVMWSLQTHRFCSNSDYATHQLWDLEQVIESLCISISLSAKWEQK